MITIIEQQPNQEVQDMSSKHPLNPEAPEFIPPATLVTVPPPPPLFLAPPPQQVVIYYSCFLSPTKPSFLPHRHVTKQMLLMGPPSEVKSSPVPVSEPCRRWRGDGKQWCKTRTRTRTRGTGRRVWVEKDKDMEKDKDKGVSCYPFGTSTTSLMIRNIPSRLSRKELMGLLDEHCRVENEKLLSSNSDEPPSEFDFLYLPIDFKKRGNLGYAFVNFTTWEGASRLFNSWKGSKWESCRYNTHKICQLCRAKFQGKEALKKHFEKSIFYCDSDEYLPVAISPPRKGCNGDDTRLVVVGSRMGSWKTATPR